MIILFLLLVFFISLCIFVFEEIKGLLGKWLADRKTKKALEKIKAKEKQASVLDLLRKLN